MVFGTSGTSAWETPLHAAETKSPPKTSTEKSTNASSTTATNNNDGTKTSSLTSLAPEENFADQLSFMKRDFKNSLEQMAEERAKETEAQEQEMATAKETFTKSMGEFRSYVKTVFITQDKVMTGLKEECRNTNEELRKWKSTFSAEMSELRESISSLMTVLGSGVANNKYNVPSQIQAGTPPGVVSPLAGYKADSFTGMSIKQRAKEIWDAELTTRPRTRLQNAIFESSQNNNVINNNSGQATAPIGWHGQQ